MKPIFLAAGVLALAALGTAAGAAPVHVTLNGVQPRGGQVLIQLQNQDQYGVATAMAAGAIQDGHASGTLAFDFDVPPGVYAASVLHDANGNFDLDLDASGKPAEGVASSNVLPVDGRRASFDEAAFTVGPDGAAIAMTMRYPN